MVYARTIKRRSGNGINASLRNVSDLMMASEGSSSQAATTGDETNTNNTIPSSDPQQPSTTVTTDTNPATQATVNTATTGESPQPPPEQGSEASASSTQAGSSDPVTSSDSQSSAQPESATHCDTATLPSSDPHSSEGSLMVQATTGDSLNNNSEENQSGYDDENPNRLNNNNNPTSNNNRVNRNARAFIVGSMAAASQLQQQHDSNLMNNNNHLNNILNNNIQPVGTTTSSSVTGQNNDNWWAPPPVHSSDLRNGGGGSGKLSLLGNGGSQSGMQLKFNQGNGGSSQVALSTENGNSPAMLPKAILKCRPNSHPFQTRTLSLIPNVEMKVGRAVARHPVSDTNAIFDCKVLSRNHAVLWYSDDKFYIRDTGSSNGTFVNNQRLSQTCLQSDKFEICSGDIVQFGVDVIENARKETHGCIVATVRLYLPDGRETKASQLTGVSAETGQVLAEDLYRMHQYIKEALLREQMLEVKMGEVQRLLESAKSSVNVNWQAMVDEDRLLNRIDILEGKVHVFQKNFGEEKLRDEMRQMQDDKLDYQHAAKEALRRVHQDRYEAVQKLSGVELALRMTEDEASVLRDKFIKSESTLNETMTRLSTVQQKHDELQVKCAELEAKLKAMEAEMASKASSEQQQLQQQQEDAVVQMVSEKSLEQLLEVERAVQESIRQEEAEVQEEQKRAEDESRKEGYGKADGLIKLFANSDLRNLEGSADIINSICNSTEEEDEMEEGAEYHGDGVSGEDDDGVSVIERVLGKEDSDTEKDTLDTAEATEAVQGISTTQLLNKLQAVEKYLKEMESSGVSKRPVIDVFDEDDNRSVASSTTSTLRGTARRGLDDVEEIRVAEDASERKIQELLEKVSLLERENETLSGDLQDRPTMSQLEAKVKLADDLQLELLAGQMKVTELREKLEESLQRYEQLQEELQRLRSAHNASSSDGSGDAKSEKEEADVERREVALDEKLLTSPLAEVEEELVLYKEKYVSLSEENIRLQKEMEATRQKYEDVMQRSMVKLLMYMGPVVAVLGYFVLWPYL